MHTKEQLHEKIRNGVHILDGATGSNLQKAGMPRCCCTEKWCLDNPEIIMDLQRRYYEAGSQIIYAPTFQAQPVGLAKVGMENETEKINADLIALTRKAAPGVLVAGDITTLAAFMETWDEDNYDNMVANYRRQIRGLVDGGADLLIGETLLYPMEAEAILEAAALENAGALMFTFTMQADGCLFTGQPAEPVFKNLEQLGAAALGFNCVAANEMTPGLVSKLRRGTKLPLICKPNAGLPKINDNGIAEYDLGVDAYTEIMRQCKLSGASLLGGCCGTAPEYIKAISGLF